MVESLPPPIGRVSYPPVIAHEYLRDKLDAITAGNMQEVIQALKDFDKKQRLESNALPGER